jgi:hypothetical protein
MSCAKRDREPSFLFLMRQKIKRVIQPVIKQNAESDLAARISVLEEEITELRTLIKKEAHFSTNIQKTDGPGAIRTPDLRRVKATS